MSSARFRAPAPGAAPARWTPELESVARCTMKQASGFTWMYERTVARAKRWGERITLASGVLAGVVGTEGLVMAVAGGGQRAAIATAVIGYAITILTLLSGTWRLDEVRAAGLVAQVDFAHLARAIQFQLALHPDERQDAREFVRGVLGEIETLKLSSPPIDAAVRADYIAKFKDNPIYGLGAGRAPSPRRRPPRSSAPPPPPAPPASPAAPATLSRAALTALLAEYEAAEGARRPRKKSSRPRREKHEHRKRRESV
jgi:hypothetical protein